MPYSGKDKEILQRLGSEFMRVAELPVQKEKIELWKSLNRCQMQRPMVCIEQLPWNELEGLDELKCSVEDPFWRTVELDLRKKLFKWNHFPVDMVLEPYIIIPRAVENSGYGLTPDVEIRELTAGTTAASQHYTKKLIDYEDIEKIRDMQIAEDCRQSEFRMEEANEIFDGVADIKQSHGISFHLGVWDYLAQLFTVEEAYIDIIERPEFVHACLDRITDAAIAGIEQANKLELHNDIANQCHCSYVYTDELLPDAGKGKGPLSKNCWAFGMAQLFTSVSPKITEEFELPYISRMAEYFGMFYYGCCERLDDRMDIIKKIPNLNLGGGGLGDFAVIPGPGEKNPRGIRKIEDWMMAHVLYPEYIEAVFDLQTQVMIKNLEIYKQAVGDRIQIVWISGTDFGMQNGELLPPDVFRKLYKPFYTKINNWVHENTNWKTFYHSCGSIVRLLDDFVEMGVDILNPVQLSASGMDAKMLKQKYGSKLTFWGGGVDTQHTLPYGTPDEVAGQVRERIKIMSEGGGYVFNTIHNIVAKVPVENLVAMYQAVREII